MLALLTIGLLGCKKESVNHINLYANVAANGAIITIQISDRSTERITHTTSRFDKEYELKSGETVTLTASQNGGTKTGTYEVGIVKNYNENIGKASGNPATVSVTIP